MKHILRGHHWHLCIFVNVKFSTWRSSGEVGGAVPRRTLRGDDRVGLCETGPQNEWVSEGGQRRYPDVWNQCWSSVDSFLPHRNLTLWLCDFILLKPLSIDNISFRCSRWIRMCYLHKISFVYLYEHEYMNVLPNLNKNELKTNWI